MTHAEIMNTITNWNGTFDKLVREFEPQDYAILLEETSFDYADYDYMSEFYENGDWNDFLYFYIADWLMYNINYGERGNATDNLFRLWNQR